MHSNVYRDVVLVTSPNPPKELLERTAEEWDDMFRPIGR